MTAPTAAQVLSAARAIIDTPAKWSRRAHARAPWGECAPADPKACQWSLAGAIGLAIFRTRTRTSAKRSLRTDVLDALRPALNLAYHGYDYGYGWICFNNNPTTEHADVLKVLDRAILHAEPFV